MSAGPRSLPGHASDATPVPSAEQAEIRRLRKELDRAQMERDILKKAIAIFSGPPR
jgi:transposase